MNQAENFKKYETEDDDDLSEKVSQAIQMYPLDEAEEGFMMAAEPSD